MTDRFRRGEHVQLRDIPRLIGRVVTDLYACNPPMVQVTFAGGDPVCVPVELIERVQFDSVTQEFGAALSPEPESEPGGIDPEFHSQVWFREG